MAGKGSSGGKSSGGGSSGPVSRGPAVKSSSGHASGRGGGGRSLTPAQQKVRAEGAAHAQWASGSSARDRARATAYSMKSGAKASGKGALSAIGRAAGEGLEEALTGATSGIGKFAQRANLESAFQKAVGEGHGVAGAARRFSQEANKNNLRVEPNSKPKEGPTLNAERRTGTAKAPTINAKLEKKSKPKY